MHPEHQGIGWFEKAFGLRTGIALTFHFRTYGLEKAAGLG
jgi:hypothetical protein